MSASLVEDTAASSKLVKFLKRPLAPVAVGPAAPEPPDVEPSSYTPLHVEPGHGRKLLSINRLQSLDSIIENYFTKFPNSEKLVPSLQSLKLPLAAPIALRHPVFDTLYTDFNPFIINSPNDLIIFLHRFLLRSICQILRVLDSFGDTAGQDWTFTTIPFTPGDESMEDVVSNPDPIVLHPHGSTSSTTEPDNVRLVILPFAPWEFTRQDFLNLTFFPIHRFDNDSPKWTKYDQVWAYLYDICFNLNCPYFVITSYEQWCFGYFSQDYSTIRFTPLVSFHKSSSVIQMLIYWIQNDFGVNQTVRSEHKKRLRTEDSPLPEIKRRRVHEILEADTTEAWRQMQGYINFGSRFGPDMCHLRRDLEHQHVRDQRDRHEKLKRQMEAIALARRVKEAKKAGRIRMAPAEKAKTIDEASNRITEMPPNAGKTEEVEEAPNADEIEGEPSIEEAQAVDGIPSIGEVRREVAKRTDMISWVEGVEETTAEEVEDDGMQMCEEVEDYIQTNGQLEEVNEADEDMMIEEEANMTDQIEEPGGGLMTVEDVDATEQANEPDGSEEPELREETDSDGSELGIGDSDKQELKETCESWQAKGNKFINTRNEYIYFEQPDSGLVMFGDKEAYLSILHSDYDNKLQPTLGGDDDALYDCAQEDLRMYHEMGKLRRIMYLESL